MPEVGHLWGASRLGSWSMPPACRASKARVSRALPGEGGRGSPCDSTQGQHALLAGATGRLMPHPVNLILPLGTVACKQHYEAKGNSH